MKTTIIAVLGVALVGVGAWFFLDHANLTGRLATANQAFIQLQEKSDRQTKTASVLISCANTTEKTYVTTKKYVSVVACVKAGLK